MSSFNDFSKVWYEEGLMGVSTLTCSKVQVKDVWIQVGLHKTPRRKDQIVVEN